MVMKAEFRVAIVVLLASAAFIALLSIPASDANNAIDVDATYDGEKWNINPADAGVFAADNVLNITGSDVSNINVKINRCEGKELAIKETIENYRSLTMRLSVSDCTGTLKISNMQDMKIVLPYFNSRMGISLDGTGKNLTFVLENDASMNSLKITNYSNVEICNDAVVMRKITADESISVNENGDVRIHEVNMLAGDDAGSKGSISIVGSNNIAIYETEIKTKEMTIRANVGISIGKYSGRAFDRNTSLTADKIEVSVGRTAYIGSDVERGECSIYGNEIEFKCALTESLVFENAVVKSKAEKAGNFSFLIHNDELGVSTMGVEFKGKAFNTDKMTVNSANSLSVEDGCAMYSSGGLEFMSITSMNIKGPIISEGEVLFRDIIDANMNVKGIEENVTAITCSSIVFERCSRMQISVETEGNNTGIKAISGDVKIMQSKLSIDVNERKGGSTLIEARGTIVTDTSVEGGTAFFRHSSGPTPKYVQMDSFVSGSTAKIDGTKVSFNLIAASTVDVLLISLIVTIVVVVIALSILTEILIRRK